MTRTLDHTEIPEQVASDNGLQFISEEFTEFMRCNRTKTMVHAKLLKSSASKLTEWNILTIGW